MLDNDIVHGSICLRHRRQPTAPVRVSPSPFPSIRKLLDGGLIEESDERPDADDQRRCNYRIAGAGRAALAAETQRLAQLVRFANRHARELLA